MSLTFNLFAKALPSSPRRRLGLLLLALSAWVVGSPSCCLAAVRTVVLSGDSAPGTAEVFAEGSFDQGLVINNNGEVAFSAGLDDLDETPGIWSEGDGIGSLRKVVLSGETAPGAGGATFESLFSPVFSDAGDVSFVGILDDFTTTGIWTDRDRPGTALTKIALEGDPAPGTTGGGTFLNGFGIQGFNNNSQVAFSSGATLFSGGVFSEGAGLGLDNVSEVLDTAPGSLDIGTGLPGIFTGFSSPSINDSGQIAFRASTNISTSVGSMGAAGVWTNSDDFTLRKVALQGESAPGTSTTFSQFFGSSAVINNSGDVAFTATLNGLIGGSLRRGVWVERDGVVEKVAFESESAPGTASTFENITDGLIDENGRAVFQSTLADGTIGLWRENSSDILEAIALEGQSAPGSAANFLGILDYTINASGQVAFAAQLDDFTGSIFALDKSEVLQRIVGGGDMIEVAAGDTREVEAVEFLGLNGFISQLGSGLNDSGQIAFTASFLDGSEGFFVSDIATLGFSSSDFDLDGDVDNDDLTDPVLGWEARFGTDLNGLDFLTWQRQFGMGVSIPMPLQAEAVPEPSSLVLLIGMALCIVSRQQTYRR